MTTTALRQLSLHLLAIGIALLAAARWTYLLPTASSVDVPIDYINLIRVAVAVAVLMLTSAAYLAKSAYRASLETLLLAIIAPIAGILGYAILHSLYVAINPNPLSLSLWPFLPTLPIVGLAFLKRRSAFPIVAFILLISALPYAHSLAHLSGDYLALRAARYAPPPSFNYFLYLLAPLFLIASITALAVAYITRNSYYQVLQKALAISIGLALILCAVQITAFFTTMAGGHAPLVIYLAFIVPTLILMIITVSVASARQHTGSSRFIRLLPVLALLPLVALVVITARGTSAYHMLRRYHPDVAYTYIHFTSDGTWRRSLDLDGNTARLRQCKRFLRAYPWSAYRPAALLALAQSQFEIWDFHGATATLKQLLREYPYLEGYPTVLAVLAALADHDPAAVLAPTPPDSFLAQWRRTQGALLAAIAAERLGLPYRALGFYAAYEDYLRSQHQTAWTPSSLRHSDSASSRIVHSLKLGLPINHTGTVTLQVFAEHQPIAGARVALVRPHYDAALPTDSRQFTGAWTIPAWNGVWGVSDRNGRVRLEKVPYGSYELVIGLPLHVSRCGYVISRAIPPIKVNRPEIFLPAIRLVPAVCLLSPKPGTFVSATPELRWKAYPGAAHYSVSILALTHWKSDLPEFCHQARATTCWVRTSIPASKVRVDSAYFINGHTQLTPGTVYMWIVSAYDNNNHLIASSEHYHDLLEPTFKVSSIPQKSKEDYCNDALQGFHFD